MQHRRALIVDRERSFAERARSCLRLVGISSDVVSAPGEALAYVETETPEIVFISVDRPKRRGFGLFSDVRRRLKQVPVVLVTSTVPMKDMLTHQKLRLHADAYLDKRELSDLDLVGTLNRLLSLKLDKAEIERLAGIASRAEASPRASADDAELRALDFDLATLLADTQINLEEDVPPVDDSYATGDSPAGDSDEDPGPELGELGRLRHELEVARRAATSSPFSSDYLKLSDRAERVQRDLVRLRDRTEARARQFEALRSKLIETAARLIDSERARDQSIDRARQLEDQLASSQRELEQNFAEERERWEQQRRGHEATLAKQEEELARQVESAAAARDAEWRRRVDELEREHRLAMDVCREEHSARMDEQRQTLQHELARKERELEDRLERTRKEHRQTLEHELARKERELEDRLERKREEHQQTLVDERDDWKDRIGEEKKRRVAELADAEAAHQERLDDLQKRHRLTTEDLRAAHAADCERSRSEQTKRLEDLAARHAQVLEASHDEWRKKLDQTREASESRLAAHREERDEEVARLVAEHEESLRRFERERDEAVARAVAETRREQLRDDDLRLTQLEEVEQGHRSHVTKLEQEHRSRVAELEQGHRSRVAELEQEQRLRVAELEQEHRSRVAELEQGHRGEVARLEQSHEAEVEQLKSRHEEELRRLRTERDSSLEELTDRLRVVQQGTIETRQDEFETRIEDLRRDHADAIASERERVQCLEEALEVASRSRPAEPDDPIEVVDAGEVDSPHERLRRLAAELDRVGGRPVEISTAATTLEAGRNADRQEPGT